MTQEEYYTAPSDDVFEDIKFNAIKLWQTYDNEYGYATDKINRIKDIKNFKDNAWYMVAMFDLTNQIKLIGMVKPQTGLLITDLLQGVE